MTVLRIYFSSKWQNSESSCPWALCEDSGTIVRSGIDALAAMPEANECMAIIAPECILAGEVATPSAPRRRWEKALPYLAEEFTLHDPENNHAVPVHTGNADRLKLYVADKAWLRRIVEACRTAGRPLRRAVPEFALPAVSPHAWTLVWDGARGFVCTSNLNGMALDNGDEQTPPLSLKLLLEAAQASPQKIEVRFPYDMESDQKKLPQWQGVPNLSPGKDWDWRSASIPPDTPSLLWGELAPPLRPLEWWPRLRPAVLLLLAVIGVEILGTNLQWAMLAYEKRAINRHMVQSFHQAFGNTAVVVNAPLQMQRNLANLRHGAGIADDGDFLPMLSTASRVLAQLPVGSIREMHYESGRLDVTVMLDSIAKSASLQRRLHDLGLNVRAKDRNTGEGVSVQLTMQQGAAT